MPEMSAGGEILVGGADTRFEASDCVRAVRDGAGGVLRFDRILEVEESGYRWDSPGARVRFRTDSRRVKARLRYTDRHRAAARNGVGFFRVDGRGAPEWRFQRPGGEGPAAVVEVALPVPEAGGMHEYELIMPYGDSVEFAGATVEARAHWAYPTPRPTTRYVAYGDSVTHGFTASDIVRGYPFQVGEENGWQVVNAGFAGRGARATDGDYLAELAGDVVSVAIGVNDWQGGTAPERYRTELSGLLGRLRAARPLAPVWLVTPLWVAPSWRPEKAAYPLEDYRRAAREVAASFDDSRVRVVEGPSLIDDDERLFDAVAVHPNDAGFAQMAARLAAAMRT